MKKLVVFRKRNKEAAPSAPPLKRVLDKFKERRSYVMIIQYRPGLRKDSDYQKLGFKVDGDFIEASQRAQELATMIGKAVAVDLKEIKKGGLCRVLAVYEITAFKDWEKENIPGENKHIREILKKVKDTKPVSYMKADTVKVRG